MPRKPGPTSTEMTSSCAHRPAGDGWHLGHHTAKGHFRAVSLQQPLLTSCRVKQAVNVECHRTQQKLEWRKINYLLHAVPKYVSKLKKMKKDNLCISYQNTVMNLYVKKTKQTFHRLRVSTRDRRWLFLQRMETQFPAPTPGSSQLPII